MPAVRPMSWCWTWTAASAPPTANRKARPTTAISAAPAIIRCSCSTSSATLNAAPCAPATSTAPMTGALCWSRWWRDTGTRTKRRFFRGDAAFALPDLYEFLEAEGYKYTIRLKANAVLQGHIAHLLKRPVGRPPEVMCSGSTPASAIRPDHGAGSAGWSPRSNGIPGELYPRVGFIVTNLTRPADRVVAFYNQRGTAEQWIKEGKNAVKWTRLSCRTMKANAVRLQLHALAYNLANFLRTLALPDEMASWSLTTHARQGGEDRREGHRPRPLRRLPDGRGRGAARPVPPHPRHDRRSATTGTGAMLTTRGFSKVGSTGEMRPPRCKMGWNRAAGDHQGGRGGDHAAMDAAIAQFGLLVGPEFGYSGVSQGRMGRPSGKCRL